MNTHEPKKNKEQPHEFGIHPPMGRCLSEAEIVCLHNNTYSTTFTDMNIAPRF